MDSDETVVSETLPKGQDDVFEDAADDQSVTSSVKTDSSSIPGGYQDDPNDLEFR